MKNKYIKHLQIPMDCGLVSRYMFLCVSKRQPLWSHGQSSRLQVQRSQVRLGVVVVVFLARITEDLLESRSSGFALEN
jgi:hypothetical protein